MALTTYYDQLLSHRFDAQDPVRKDAMRSIPKTLTFVPTTVHKRDVFSQTISGHLAEDPEFKVVLRKLDEVPWYAKPLSWFLAQKEAKGLEAVKGIEGTPVLLRQDKEGLLRSWSHGTPLQLAKPTHPDWYKDAKRLLRQMRARGVTHNDIAKPQNWLMTPDGKAAVIDFQLASTHRKKGKIFRVMAREDLRHLLKQKKSFAPHLLTPSEKKMLAQKALPSRIWMATGKKLYKFITRKVMNWSDGEGTGDRIANEGPAIEKALLAHPDISAIDIEAFALPAKGVGIYVFAETDLSIDKLHALLPENPVDYIQPVSKLPRNKTGQIRSDILQLIAANRLDELDLLLSRETELQEIIAPIINSRLNLTDRILKN